MKTPPVRQSSVILALLLVGLCTALGAEEPKATGEGEWVSLFNGKNLDGWTVKIAKHPLGDNHADTFRVEDGVIKVAYDKYPRFDEQFGHLYSNAAYSHYVLQLEYKFLGTVMADAPSWCSLNSGVMVHSQSPLTMGLDQLWPASLEFQFLADGSTAGKQTGNVCTPGTNLELNGAVVTEHIIEAKGRTYPVGEWIPVEVEVHGNDEVIHRVHGVEVVRYRRPQLDPREADAARLIAQGVPIQVGFGHIALQAEAQPVWFRNIRLRALPTTKP